METWKASWLNQKKAQQKSHQKLMRKLKSQKPKQLDEVAQELHEEVFSEVDCMQCANCCTSIPPIVNRTDLNRISKTFSMKPSEFAETYLTEDEDGDTVMRQSPCPFLLEDNACMIYDIRPKACRKYPHTDGAQFSSLLKLHATNTQYCPAVFHVLERLEERLEKKP